MRLSIIRGMTTAPILRTLDASGHRLTEPRRAVAELVDRRSGHFSAADLVADAHAERPGIGRATVFRALELFQELGVIERIDLPSGEHAYVVCEPEHHHHVICSNCGRSADIDDRRHQGGDEEDREAHRLPDRHPPRRAVRTLPDLRRGRALTCRSRTDESGAS